MSRIGDAPMRRVRRLSNSNLGQRMKILYLSVVLFAVATPLWNAPVFGQSDTESVTDASETPSDETETDVASEEAEPTPEEAIRKLIEDGEPAEAAETLDEEIANSAPDQVIALQRLRSEIMSGFVRQRKYLQALEQGEKLVDALLDTEDAATNSGVIFQTVSRARFYGSRAGATERVGDLVGRVLAEISESTKDTPLKHVQIVGTLVPLQASQLGLQEKIAAAEELVDSYLASIDELELEEDNEVDRLITKTRLLLSKTRLPDANEEAKDALKRVMTSAMERYPDSIEMLTEYAKIEVSLIGSTVSNDPEAASARVEELDELIGDRYEANMVLKSIRGTMGAIQRRIESTLKLMELIGNPAPEFEIDAWVNEGETTLETLQGKVVLVDFWAVWCGPCIAAFPHLREWREEFKDKGFEVVGATQYYGYGWDDENNRISRGEKASNEDELVMLENFLAEHELEHPVIVVPEDNEMYDNYGVTGIPQLVVIDREGVVQMVKVGAGKETAEQIHEKLSELLND
ncbi:thioredoxin related protein [Rhodopirellula sallentina SM41]|uniref:Thioredoxin related protein n=2 Tax=Rhodopirellula TaxID=265488 RepID=M5TZ22_9BACT|nr:thioredoxin related protein [Rhodopirellula sallentina SM41]